MSCAHRAALLLLAIPLLWLAADPARAQPTGEDVEAAVRVLQQATFPAANRQHHAVLRGLRRTHDPDLRPLYAWLSRQEHADLQTHGLLGLALSSPDRSIDLARLAEIDDQRQRVDIIGAALDDELISRSQMSTLLDWRDLNQGVRQAIAIRLIAEGGLVGPTLFAPALAGDPAQDSPGELMERGIAGIALAQLGDRRGLATLRSIDRLPASPQTHAVRVQLLSLAARHDLRGVAEWATEVAKTPSLDPRLRDAALRSALTLKAPDSSTLWRKAFADETELAPRIRLALMAAGVSDHISPSMLDGLDAGGSSLLRLLIDAGQAAASDPPIDLRPLEALADLGYPPGSRWLVVYGRESAGPQAPVILERVILGYDKGHDSGRRELTAIAIEAAASLAEMEEASGTQTLQRMIHESNDTIIRQILYSGIIRSDARGLGELIGNLSEPPDEISRDTFLVLRLRHGLSLTAEQWQRVGELVGLPGKTEPGIRAELAWYTVKTVGRTKDVLDQLTR
ncbi:MAG: hypothetical protein AAGC44_15225 [Planctomycetota bacterium]